MQLESHLLHLVNLKGKKISLIFEILPNPNIFHGIDKFSRKINDLLFRKKITYCYVHLQLLLQLDTCSNRPSFLDRRLYFQDYLLLESNICPVDPENKKKVRECINRKFIKLRTMMTKSQFQIVRRGTES